MARPSGPKTRCGERWTEARFTSFIKSALRGATRKWAPLQDVKKEARVSRGFYKCAGCEEVVPATTVVGRKRVDNAIVDHIKPVIDPAVGFTTWDSFIENMFCERDNLQILCKACHDSKCQEEIDIATARRQKEKLDV